MWRVHSCKLTLEIYQVYFINVRENNYVGEHLICSETSALGKGEQYNWSDYFSLLTTQRIYTISPVVAEQMLHCALWWEQHGSHDFSSCFFSLLCTPLISPINTFSLQSSVASIPVQTLASKKQIPLLPLTQPPTIPLLAQWGGWNPSLEHWRSQHTAVKLQLQFLFLAWFLTWHLDSEGYLNWKRKKKEKCQRQ